jgi:hypothetical protein
MTPQQKTDLEALLHKIGSAEDRARDAMRKAELAAQYAHDCRLLLLRVLGFTVESKAG